MGKELILKTLRHEKTDEIPWVPFAGVHAGQLKGFTAEEMLTNADNIVESRKQTVYAGRTAGTVRPAGRSGDLRMRSAVGKRQSAVG